MVGSNQVERIALDIGFHACGVSRVERLGALEGIYSNWLGNGYHGSMSYMERNFELRLDPSNLVSGAKSVISVLLSYNTGDLSINIKPPRIARYAARADYHFLMKRMLWEMLNQLRECYGKVNGRAFVDSAPVFEREWAVRAGLGWIGKNSMLINRELGSYIFIGELIVDIEIEPNARMERNRCGTCTRCMDACPNKAIIAPGVIDARKCISYLTIERNEPIATGEVANLDGWCFGCDICQEVCPWNRKAKKVDGLAQGTKTFEGISAMQIANLSKVEFTNQFGNTPLSRAGYEKIKRTVELITGGKP